ncbi:MAG TPA: HAMP domain-containing protein, partial [Nitrospirota bacterium]|nr:HAMP domain-containing protein [Nitrospirota bacterium]
MLNFKDRLGFRLSFYITLAVLLVGTLVASVFLYGYWRHDRDSLSRYGLKVAEELALPARGWLVGEDAFALHEAIEARLKSESDFEYPLEYIEVLDAGGMPVASVYGVIREEAKTLKEGRREAAAKAAAPFVGVLELPGGDFFDSAYPVAVDGGRVGTIRVGTSDKGLRADIRRSAWTAAGVLFCAAILGALLGGRIASWVAAPINALVRGAEELSGGNLDYRVTASSPRELQALSGSFNQMAGNLKEKVDSLTTAKREAEELSRKLSASYRESKHTAERLQETNEFVTDLAFRIEETNKSLEAEKNQTETIINSIGDGLVALDREGRVILINPEAEEMLGVKKEEVRGRPFCEAARALMEKAEGGGGLLESFTAPAPSASSGTDSCT